ncbi:PIN domain-containing protein [Nocardia testacea]|uniref:PIN domain-containing protein n=1 Tax=Nocardia testacea TaxID=248551 RepID=UPI0033D53C6F
MRLSAPVRRYSRRIGAPFAGPTEVDLPTARIPAGRRRDLLKTRVETRVLPLFTGRVLAFDPAASAAYAEVMAAACTAGTAIATADGLIAATGEAANMSVATRDTAPFRAAGVRVINPWGR